MTPTLSGRLQTRFFAILVLGLLWTALVGPLLAFGARLPLRDVYQGTLLALLVVLAAGILWELVYHALQQLRWEKDWPTLFGLLTGINEGLVAYLLVAWLGDGLGIPVPVRVFIVHFATVWLFIWLFLNGPMRVPFIRWRFNGGRLL